MTDDGRGRGNIPRMERRRYTTKRMGTRLELIRIDRID
jgi:hypothetical protein